MKPVRVYTTDTCPYCTAAKRLLRDKGVAFEELDVTDQPEKRAWLVQATGQRTVPQIFFGDDPVGGFSDLDALVKRGELDARLGR